MKEKTKRTKEIKLRLTESEHQRLSTLSGTLPLAEWVREYALGAAQTDIYDHLARQQQRLEQRQKQVARISVDPALLRALAGIGNNINQIARIINLAHKAGSSLELTKVALELEHINHALEAIRLDYTAKERGDYDEY